MKKPVRAEEEDTRIKGGERLDFIFTRGLLLRGDLPDSIPIDPSKSGSYSLGIGLGIPVGRFLAIRFEPRLTWHNVFYKQEPQKTYPSDSGNQFIFEKERGFYLEMPVGFKFNLVRNSRQKVRLYLEVGAQGGLLAGSVYKRRSLMADDTRYTEKIHNVKYLNPLRYGFYGRLGTKIFAFHVFYRMSEVFDMNQVGTTDGPNWLPNFTNLEVGAAVVF